MYTETTDGHRIKLHYLEPRPLLGQPRVYCVLAHGIFTNHEEETLVAIGQALSELGIGSVRFDFRGHGASPMPSTTFSPVSALEDLGTVVEWAQNNADVVNLVGSSFGGSISMLHFGLDERTKIGRLVLLNPVVDYRSTFLSSNLQWGQQLFSPHRLDTLALAGQVRLMPHFVAGRRLHRELTLLHPEDLAGRLPKASLVFHGSDDEKVPAERTVEVMASAGIEVDLIEGATHGFKDPTHHAYVVQNSVAFLERASASTERDRRRN